jgi:hypothetical protein
VLAAEIDDRWPDRPDHLDGWIGDKAHAARVSDHNPDRAGIVRALDVTSIGIEPWRIIEAAKRHPAAHYVIHQGQIWDADLGWAARSYSGPNSHADHLHISVRRGRHAASSRPWGVALPSSTRRG